MILAQLREQCLIHAPRWVVEQLQYLTVMGSNAYGVSGDLSDVDLYGVCIPPKDMVFPHLSGEISGFGAPVPRFDGWLQHHVKAPDGGTEEYDIQIFGIVRYFHLCMGCNPNLIDSLFTPRRCVRHMTAIGEIMRENRRLFLHKGAWRTFKGYAYKQMHHIRTKTTASSTQRATSIAKHGYDLKFLYHLVRLLDEVEQIMVEHDLDLERNREQLKSVRRGEWSCGQIDEYFQSKESTLEDIYARSTLREAPDEAAIKALLLSCLEMHFGSLGAVIPQDRSVDHLIRDLEQVLDRHRAP